MTIEEQIKYWITSAEQDIPVAESLFEKGHFVWCLFVGHLILEKSLKAHYVNFTHTTPPKIHDLIKLAEKSNIKLLENQIIFFDEIMDFMIEARYPDYKEKLFKAISKTYAHEKLSQIIETHQWLKSLLK